MLLHEVEGEAVAAWRPRRPDLRFQLDLLARFDATRKGRARTVPDDRIPERVEPVVGELHALLAARLPRRGAGVGETEASACGLAGARLPQLVAEPAHRERPRGHRMLPDALHFEG